MPEGGGGRSRASTPDDGLSPLGMAAMGQARRTHSPTHNNLGNHNMGTGDGVDARTGEGAAGAGHHSRRLCVGLGVGTLACLGLAVWGGLCLHSGPKGGSCPAGLNLGAAMLVVGVASCAPFAFAFWVVVLGGKCGGGARGRAGSAGRRMRSPLLSAAAMGLGDGDDAGPSGPTEGAARAAPSAFTDGFLYLYVGHFLSAWGDRMWQFAIPLIFIDVFVDTLLPGALFALVIYLCCVVTMPAVGRWVDRGDRLVVVRKALVAENLAIAASAVLLVVMACSTVPSDDGSVAFHCSAADGKRGKECAVDADCAVEAGATQARCQPDVGPAWDASLVATFVGILLLGIVAEPLNGAQTLALERDWVVVMAEDATGGEPKAKTAFLARLNTILRRIDLSCKVLAPAAFGVIYGHSGPLAAGPLNRYERAAVGAGVVGVWNLCSFPLEYLFVGMVFQSCKRLHGKAAVWRAKEAEKTRRALELAAAQRRVADRSGDYEDAVDAAMAEVEAQERGARAGAAAAAAGGGCCAAWLPSWAAYCGHRVFLCSLGYSFLYMTVLDNGAIMTGYLEWRAVDPSLIGAGRGVGAVFGLVGTVVFPWLMRRGALDGRDARLTLLQTGTTSVWWFWAFLAPCVVVFVLVGETPGSDYTLLGCMAASRIWLWAFDLAETQLMQEYTHEGERGLINGMQRATYQLLTSVVLALGMVEHDPRNFKVLVVFSVAVVFTAACLYTTWARRERAGRVAELRREMRLAVAEDHPDETGGEYEPPATGGAADGGGGGGKLEDGDDVAERAARKSTGSFDLPAIADGDSGGDDTQVARI